MTTRDLCYWLQGFFELSMNSEPAPLAVAWVDTVEKHCDLVLVSEPLSSVAHAIKAVARIPSAVQAIVAYQFVHVIDQTMPPIEKDPAHKPPVQIGGVSPSGHTMRC